MDLVDVKREKVFKPIYLVLFMVTLITTTFAGAEWMHGRPILYYEDSLTLSEILDGFHFSIPFLVILTFHEFGHYFTARHYKVKVTLPYYIPMWLGFIGIPLTIGTMGAFIRIKEPIRSRLQYFDIGVAGPLAGFVVAMFVLYYGYTHLPAPEHIFTIHPDYQEYGLDYAKHVYDEPGTMYLGNNLTMMFFERYVATDPNLVPNPYEVIHYPWIFAGFLALFFTALNLLPIGQLDGGHVLYGLFGSKWHGRISLAIFFLFITYAGLGLISLWDPVEDLMLSVPLYVGFLFITLRSLKATNRDKLLIAVSIFSIQFFTVYFFPNIHGYEGWLVFSFIIGRFLGVYHPPALEDRPLSTGRKVIGWIALIIFIISFSPEPFVLVR